MVRSFLRFTGIALSTGFVAAASGSWLGCGGTEASDLFGPSNSDAGTSEPPSSDGGAGGGEGDDAGETPPSDDGGSTDPGNQDSGTVDADGGNSNLNSTPHEVPCAARSSMWRRVVLGAEGPVLLFRQQTESLQAGPNAERLRSAGRLRRSRRLRKSSDLLSHAGHGRKSTENHLRSGEVSIQRNWHRPFVLSDLYDGYGMPVGEELQTVQLRVRGRVALPALQRLREPFPCMVPRGKVRVKARARARQA